MNRVLVTRVLQFYRRVLQQAPTSQPSHQRRVEIREHLILTEQSRSEIKRKKEKNQHFNISYAVSFLAGCKLSSDKFAKECFVATR